MSVASERPVRGPPGSEGPGSPAPRRKILVRKVKRSDGSVATTQDGFSTRATTPQQGGIDFDALHSTFGNSTAHIPTRVKGQGPLPRSAPGIPAEPATEDAVAPRGPRPGRRGKREEWTVLGDVGE